MKWVWSFLLSSFRHFHLEKDPNLVQDTILPIKEAVLLVKYIVARYQGNHVLWTLGGDSKYYGDLEERWKSIGYQIFGEGKYLGLVTLHPHGLSWIGDLYDDQDWYDLITYQSSHSDEANTVNWINKGPIADRWQKIRPAPIDQYRA